MSKAVETLEKMITELETQAQELVKEIEWHDSNNPSSQVTALLTLARVKEQIDMYENLLEEFKK